MAEREYADETVDVPVQLRFTSAFSTYSAVSSSIGRIHIVRIVKPTDQNNPNSTLEIRKPSQYVVKLAKAGGILLSDRTNSR